MQKWKKNVKNVKKVLSERKCCKLLFNDSSIKHIYNNLKKWKYETWSSDSAIWEIAKIKKESILKRHTITIYDDGTDDLYCTFQYNKIGGIEIYSNTFTFDSQGTYDYGMEATFLNENGKCLFYIREGEICSMKVLELKKPVLSIDDAYDYIYEKEPVHYLNKELFAKEMEKYSGFENDYINILDILEISVKRYLI